MTAELRSKIENRIRELGHLNVSIDDLSALTGGASRQMWKVTTNAPGEWGRFILRMDHPSDPDPQANAQEAEVLSAANAAGVPSPAVLDHSSDPDVLGTPYVVLSFVEGETIARKILRDEKFAVARTRLGADLGRAAGLISQVVVDGLDIPVIDDPVGKLLKNYEDAEVDRPALLLGLRELAQNRPEPAPHRTLVHGDMRMGNLMVDENGLAAVLDWEITHIGDPYEDLGYVCMRAWRFGGPGRVAGTGDVEEFLDAYSEVTGFRPTEEQLTWWEARATAWWGIGCLRQMQRSVPGHSNELELLAIGRRVAEQEHDLLALLYPDVEPAACDPSEAAASTSSAVTLFTDPSASTLLTGLENYLDSDLVNGSGEANRFKARIAKNVVSLLGREQELGTDADRWYTRHLEALGVRNETDLTERIAGLEDTSSGSEQTRSIVSVLKTAARLRLEVSNPRYLQDSTGGRSSGSVPARKEA